MTDKLPPMTRTYQFYAAVRTDHDTAVMLREAMEAAATALTDPDRVDEKGWLLLVGAEAMARVAIEKRRAAAA